jgi:tRNA 2-thiouridine synthesizing protein B
MNLHLIFSSPFSSSSLKECLAIIQPKDAIVLLEDGVYAIQHPDLSNTSIQFKCFAVTADTDARGLTKSNNLTCITYDELVDLTLEYQKTISWR